MCVCAFNYVSVSMYMYMYVVHYYYVRISVCVCVCVCMVHHIATLLRFVHVQIISSSKATLLIYALIDSIYRVP